MKKSFSMFFPIRNLAQPTRFCCRDFFRRIRYLVSAMAILLLCLPNTSRAFSFSSVVDDVGNAVKSGASTIEDGVKQVFPGDDKNKKIQQNSTSEKQDPAAPALAVPSKSVTKGKKESTAPVATTATAASPKAKTAGGIFADDSTTAAAPAPASPRPTVATAGAVAAAPKAVDETAKPKVEAAKASSGGTVFSKDPINPDAPPASLAAFTAGDRIYGMLKAKKPWKELLGSSDYLIVYVSIDGTQKVSKTIGLKRADLLARDYVIIDIAPDPASMTNYSDRDIVFPEKDGYRFGPELFTKYLSELSPGKHSFRIEAKAYGDIYAAGEFSISGSDYGSYATLLADIKNSGNNQQKMPKPGMTDIALQNEMLQLLKNSGWPEIRRLIIVDKDWWLDRVSGGDSPIQSRHIEAAAAAKDASGGFYYCHVTFHQPMLITGNWGKLALTDTGKKKIITEENINQ